MYFFIFLLKTGRMPKDFKVNLKHLSKKGLNFSFSQKSVKMTAKLKPLIGDNDYNITLHIQDEGLSSYSISGHIQTHINLLCSRCAYEFKEPLNKTFKEQIMVQKKLTRIDKEAKSNHFSELASQENCTLIDKAVFDIGDFLHELIAIEEPLRPLGTKNCDEESFHCEHLESMKQILKKKGTGNIFFSDSESGSWKKGKA